MADIPYAGPIFFEKNKIDIDLADTITITVTDAVATDSGQTYTDFLRNRNNVSGWATTGSTDAANTNIVFDFIELVEIDSILLILHNFKAYTLQYWDGAAYQNFSTPIAQTVNTADTTYHTFTAVETTKVKLIITGAMVVNDDKYLRQAIFTKRYGQFATGMRIQKPEHSQARRKIDLLSGKAKITRNLGGFSVKISKDNVISTADLTLVETLFQVGPHLVWLCGNDESSQFRTIRKGFRLEDIYLMDLKNEYVPEPDKGFYRHGTNIMLDLVEVA